MPATLKLPEVKYDITPLKGGLDQLTPTLSLGPGACREAVNFECSPTGGYRRVGGYERFDGTEKPSDATYAIVQVTSFVNLPTVGQTLTGATSGATGQIIAINTAENYLVLTLTTGTYTSLEIVSVGITMIGVHTTQTVTVSKLLNAQYLNLAADAYRALIAEVPGSGPVRGIVSHIVSGVHNLYVFRNNVGGTACLMYRATAFSWSLMTFFNEVFFTAGGTSTPADGDTVTQGANSAIIRRVALESGSWVAGTAAGRLIVETPAPGNFAGGAATIGAVNVTLSGLQTPITLLPGGKFEFDIKNFAGQLSTRRIYGCDGVNRAFEWDGTVFVPIHTGADPDIPKHIKVHHFHLLLSIGGSIMGSSIGNPYAFSALAGAFEITVGDNITGFLIQPGNQDTATLGVLSRNGSGMLYGTTSADFKYVALQSETGAIDYMCQNLDQSYMLDDRGVISLRAVQEFGNFTQATITQQIQTFINEKRAIATYSTISKDLSQFRLFFSDGSGLYVTLVNGKFLGAMPTFMTHAFNCAWNGETPNGEDVSYAGALDSGYVYQLDRGSSFDGEPIDASITLNWNFLKSPRTRKRYRKASLEVQGATYASIAFGYTLGYNSDEIDQPTPKDYDTNLGAGGVWDVDHWDAFVWDGRVLSPTEVELTGTAENIQVTLQSTTDYILPYVLNSLVLHYTPRRGLR